MDPLANTTPEQLLAMLESIQKSGRSLEEVSPDLAVGASAWITSAHRCLSLLRVSFIPVFALHRISERLLGPFPGQALMRNVKKEKGQATEEATAGQDVTPEPG